MSPAKPAHAAVRQVQVSDAEGDGQRLDNFLRRQLKGVPASHVQQIIRSGQVRVNRARASAATKLTAGDVVRIPPVRVAEPPPSSAQTPGHYPAPDLPVLFEDDALLALNKPAGVAVHGGSGVSLGVIEVLRAERDARFLELVHRLDRDTSGVLVLAKKRSALTRLHAAWRERMPEKVYLALVAGQWSGGASVRMPLTRYVNAQGERRVRADPDGQAAVTQVRVLQLFTTAAGETFSLLRLRILTGRTHQIRVHLAESGHPIVGDEKYGDFALNRMLARGAAGWAPGQRLPGMYLHAERLRLQHPMHDEALTLEAPLPVHFERVLQALKPFQQK